MLVNGKGRGVVHTYTQTHTLTLNIREVCLTVIFCLRAVVQFLVYSTTVVEYTGYCTCSIQYKYINIHTYIMKAAQLLRLSNITQHTNTTPLYWAPLFGMLILLILLVEYIYLFRV